MNTRAFAARHRVIPPARIRGKNPQVYVGAMVLLVVMMLSVLSGNPTFAQPAGDEVSRAPEAFKYIAGQLQNRKAVALADFAHENAFSFYTLRQVLSNWLDLAGGKDVALALVLEETSQTAEILQEYLRTGQTEPVLNHFLPFTSLDRLEFYQELRDFYVRVQRENEGTGADQRIRFSLRGFEPFSLSGPANGPTGADASAAQAGDVANERDRRVVAGLTAYRQDHPSEQILIFYGMDHLRTRPTRQSWAGRLFGAAQQWQPLGYLLKQHWGKDFLSIAQAPFPPAARDPRDPRQGLTDRNIILDAADIPWRTMQINPGDYDAVVFLNSSTIDEAHLLRYVCCHRVLDCAIERLAAIEAQKPSTFADVFAGRLTESLQLLTGQAFDTSAQWRSWLLQNPYDGFARMDSDAFAEAVRRECGQPMNKSRGSMLLSLGLTPALWAKQGPTDPEEWRNNTWKEWFPRVRFLQCLGIYWVGYPAEKEKAKEYLVRFSGTAFEDPARYLKWYRRECLKLAY